MFYDELENILDERFTEILFHKSKCLGKMFIVYGIPSENTTMQLCKVQTSGLRAYNRVDQKGLAKPSNFHQPCIIISLKFSVYICIHDS